MHIGEKIREKRENLGISRYKLAMILGVSPMTIYAWEKGRRSPRYPTIKAIESILGKIELEKDSLEYEKRVLEKLRQLRDMSNFIEIDSSEVIREIREERTKY